MAFGKKKTPGVFKCPNCAGSIRLTALGISINAACQSCGSIIDVRDENYQIIEKAKRKTKKTEIELGTRGKLFGIEWEVIGYQQKCDETGDYKWDEYLLFNPYHGFRFLVQNEGHWSFVRLIMKDVKNVIGRNDVEFEDKDYKVFLRGGSKVQYVMGEFYWQIKLGDQSTVADYINPPYMLSMEAYKDELTWSMGEYIDAEDVRDAFKIVGGIMYPVGVAPNQPSPYAEIKRGTWLISFIFVAALTIIQIISYGAAKNTPVFSQQLDFTPYNNGQEMVADVDVPYKIANLEFETYAPVDNNWLELDMDLVSTETDKKYEILQGVEYYHGYDSDGSWSEGGQRRSGILSSVPGGHYKLVISPGAGAFANGQSVSAILNIKRDVPIMSNYIYTLMLLLLYPLYLGLRSYSFEKRRWSTSDYAPQMYQSSTGDDDDGDYSASYDSYGNTSFSSTGKK